VLVERFVKVVWSIVLLFWLLRIGLGESGQTCLREFMDSSFRRLSISVCQVLALGCNWNNIFIWLASILSASP
jgi:hypothetical protein